MKRNKESRADLLGLIFLLLWSVEMGSNVLAQDSSELMHRRHSADSQGPLINLFQEVLVFTKKGDWESVGKRVQQSGGPIGEHKKNFGIDMMPRIQKAVATKSEGETLKYLAEVIYLDMRMQFKMILASKLGDFLEAKEKLDLAKEYYTTILSGNIKRRAPERAEKIEMGFLAAQGALGNPGFYLDLPTSPPDPKGFEEASKMIEAEIASVYTYFKE